MRFALAMVQQVTQGLETLHNFGYSHSDLKTENICARIGKDEKFKFTLIDFGVVSKLPRIGEVTKHKSYRGNLLASSIDHIRNSRASVVDDIYSLLCVAYYFVFGTLPWRDKMNNFLDACKDKVPKKDYQKLYIKMRTKYSEEFDQ